MTSRHSALKRSQSGRSKRSLRRTKKNPQGRISIDRPRRTPSMVTRNARSERSYQPSAHQAPRPIHLHLAAEGAEIRLPALPKIQIGWRAISAFILVSMLLLLYLAISSPFFTIGKIELKGAQRLNAYEVNGALSVIGSSVFSANEDELQALLSTAFPELKSVEITLAFPARVMVEVQERRPALAWKQSGITVWVDGNGIAFIPQGEALDLLTIEALEPPPNLIGDEFHRHQLIRADMVEAILALGEFSPAGLPILYDPELGFGWQEEAGWLAFFGFQIDKMNQRFAIYDSILNDLSNRGLTPSLVSVAHLHAPYYRVDY